MLIALMRFLEVGQIVTAAAGLVVGFHLYRRSIGVLNHYRERGVSNGRLVAAELFARTDGLVLCVHVMLAVIACVSLSAQLNSRVSLFWFENGTWTIPFLRMAINLTLLTKQLMTARYRERLLVLEEHGSSSARSAP